MFLVFCRVIVKAMAVILLLSGAVRAEIHHVGPGQFIQQVVNQASQGDVVIVDDGTYTENVQVRRPLTIRSKHGYKKTTVIAAKPDTSVFTIYSNHVTIEGFTLYGATEKYSAAVKLSKKAGHCVVRGNLCGLDPLHNNVYGIFLYGKNRNNTISANQCFSNSLAGIRIQADSRFNTIRKNVCINNQDYGLYLADASHNDIVRNEFRSNYCPSIRLSDSTENKITDNKLSSNMETCISRARSEDKVFNNRCNDDEFAGRPELSPRLAAIIDPERSYMHYKYSIPDLVLPVVDSKPPSSSCISREKDIYCKALDGKTYDVLVVPFQTQLEGVDLSGRMLMAHHLAVEIESTTSLTVAPLGLVSRALGRRSRFIQDTDVYRLAKHLGVSRIIWGFAGSTRIIKNRTRQFRFSIIVQKGKHFSRDMRHERIKVWQDMEVSPEFLPFQAFAEKMDEVMAFIDLPERRASKAKTLPGKNAFDIPESPRDMLNRDMADPIAEAYLLQLLGILVPEESDGFKEELFVRSLAVLSTGQTGNPENKLLYSRALFYLHRRPAALKILSSTKKPEERALLEYINGNLTLLETYCPTIKHPLKKLFTRIELESLKCTYSPTTYKVKIESIIKQVPEDWAYFVKRILTDHDSWAHHSNIPLKEILDRDLPFAGFDLETLIQGMAQKGASAYSDQTTGTLELSFFEHIQKLLMQGMAGDFEYRHSRGPNSLDYVCLLQGIGEANLLESIKHQLHIQSNVESALKTWEMYSGVYNDHPVFTVLKGTILEKKVRRLNGYKEDNTRREIYENALNAFWHLGGQTPWAFEAWRQFYDNGQIRKQDDFFTDHRKLVNGFLYDYPFLHSYMVSYIPMDEELNWSTDFKRFKKHYYRFLKEKKFEEAGAFLETYKGRFQGHPKKQQLYIKCAEKQGDIAKIESLCKHEIDNGSMVWSYYSKLGKLYIHQYRYDESLEAFMGYPLFEEKNAKNRVALSNRAYQAGSELFWRGAYKQARPLYEFSAALSTGSSAGLTSAARLALLDRNYLKSHSYFIRRARRYDDSYAYRDAMSLLHLTGQSDGAWSLFNFLLGRYKVPNIWTSAIVGHRMQDFSWDQLLVWMDQISRLSPESLERSFIARYALLSLFDRKPDMEKAESVSNFDDFSKYYAVPMPKYNRDPFKNRLRVDETPQLLTDQEISRIIKSKGNIVSLYGYFAVAYTHLLEHDEPSALDIMKEASAYYDYSYGAPAHALLPYLAWAGMKCGGRSADMIRDFVEYNETRRDEARGSYKKDFDNELAMAVVTGLSGHHSNALNHLRTAFSIRPHIINRPAFPWYQMVEICEWLYLESHDDQYRTLLLDWVQRHQVIQPMFAWAYAVEARYTSNEKDLIRCLAMTLFLDPQSSRISDISVDKKDKARQWLKAHEPIFGWERKVKRNGI